TLALPSGPENVSQRHWHCWPAFGPYAITSQSAVSCAKFELPETAPLNIVFATSEVAPFAKTGGLADVCGAVPVDLRLAGHNVAVIMPAYRQVKACGLPLEPLGVKFDIPISNKIVRGRLLRGVLPGSDVPIFFVEQDDYFDRPELYRHKGEDYKDNCERYVFYCRAALESIRLLHLQVDVVHCHDCQTALSA